MKMYEGFVANACKTQGSNQAFSTPSGTLTYDELARACNALAIAWQGQPTQRVGLWVDNSIDTLIALHALNLSGRSVALLRPADHTPPEALMMSSGVDHVYVPETKTLVPTSSAEETKAKPNGLWGWDDVQFSIQSSGTSGAPKWIDLTTRQLTLSAFGSAIRLGHLPSDHWLNVLAPGYMGWLAAIVRCALYGTSVHCMPYSVSAVLAYLKTETVTQVSLVPSMLTQLMDTDASVLKPIRNLLVGGGPTHTALLNRCHAHGIYPQTTWGLTEAGSQVVTRMLDDRSNLGHVGMPMPFVHLNSDHGTMTLSGPLVNTTITTNDVGHLDRDGRVTIFGRGDDVIVTSGHKVHPKRVESHFVGLPNLVECCAIGLPDPVWGQVVTLVCAIVDTAQRSQFISALNKVCDELPSMYTPRRVFLCDNLPKNEMSKLLRRVVRTLLFELDETMLIQPTDDHLRQSNGREGVQVDSGMSEADDSTNRAQVINDVVTEGQGASTNPNDTRLNGQIVPLSEGFLEVTFRINEGQTYRMCVKELIPVAEDRKEKLFESDVCVFEDTTEKDDARAVHLVESRFEVVTKSHDKYLLRRNRKAKL